MPFYECVLGKCIYVHCLWLAKVLLCVSDVSSPVCGPFAGVWSGRLFPTVIFTEAAVPTVAELTGYNRQLPICHPVPAKETRWALVCTDNMSLLRMGNLWALLSLWVAWACCVMHSAKIPFCFLGKWIKFVFLESIAVAQFLPFSFSSQELSVHLPVTTALCISFIFPDSAFVQL